VPPGALVITGCVVGSPGGTSAPWAGAEVALGVVGVGRVDDALGRDGLNESDGIVCVADGGEIPGAAAGGIERLVPVAMTDTPMTRTTIAAHVTSATRTHRLDGLQRIASPVDQPTGYKWNNERPPRRTRSALSAGERGPQVGGGAAGGALCDLGR
jgi:hypothetical protein